MKKLFMANVIANIITKHIEDGGLVTSPDTLTNNIVKEVREHLMKMIADHAWNVQESTKRQGASVSWNKKEDKSDHKLATYLDCPPGTFLS